MSSLFTSRAFTSFGPSALAVAPPVLYQVHGRRPATLRAKVRQECPRRPGVYGMLSARGELIYVGKAKCLRTRLLSYFRPKSRDAKAGRIVRHTRTLVWEPVPSEFAALLRELELIRRWRPRFNVAGQPHRRRTYVCLGRQPAPHVFLAGKPPRDTLACFGPVPAGRKVREAVRRLNDAFGLRDCPQAQAMVFADQAELFPVLRAAACIRHEIGTCLGPCAAACTRADYGRQVRAARAFLEGADRSLLETLEGDMTAAAAARAFERAAALRDRLDILRWLRDRLGRLRRVREEQSFIYPVPGYDGEDVWYLVHGGRVAAALPAPRTAAQQRAAARQLRSVCGERPASGGVVPVDQVDGVWLVAAWFRRHVEERQRLLDPAALLAACRRRR
jgi:excinuclease ABC subunit C